MLRYPPSCIAWTVLEKAFKLTRANGSRTSLNLDLDLNLNLADGAGSGVPPVPPVTTVLDFAGPGLPPLASHVWSPCPRQMHECAQNLHLLYREHKGEAEEEGAEGAGKSSCNAGAENAEVAAAHGHDHDVPSTPPSTPCADAHLRGVTPNGVESDDIFDGRDGCDSDRHDSDAGGPLRFADGPASDPADAAAMANLNAKAKAEADSARRSKRPAPPTTYEEEAEAPASNKRRGVGAARPRPVRLWECVTRGLDQRRYTGSL